MLKKFKGFASAVAVLCLPRIKYVRHVMAVSDKICNLNSARNFKVCIIGGGLEAMYTALLLKQSRILSGIHLVDLKKLFYQTTADVNQIDTSATLIHFTKDNLELAVKDVDIIALMDENDTNPYIIEPLCQFQKSCNFVRRMTVDILKYNSESMLAVFVRPVTATLPMVSKICSMDDCWNPNKLIGSVAVYSMRLDTKTADLLGLNPGFLYVPIVGGADASTVVPLLSCINSFDQFTSRQLNVLRDLVRNTDNEVAIVEPRGSVLFSSTAAAKLILSLSSGLCGHNDITACAFVRSNILPGCQFFTSELQFGRRGVERNCGLPKISSTEMSMIDQAINVINKFVRIGVKAV